MANHTIRGFRVEGNFADGSATYLGENTYRWFTEDDFTFFSFSSNLSDGGVRVTNVFGTGTKATSPRAASQTLETGSFDYQFIFGVSFDPAATQTAQIIQLYDVSTDWSHLFIIGGTKTNIPSDQASLDAWMADVNGVTGWASGIEFIDAEDMANTVTRDRDVYVHSSDRRLDTDFGVGNDVIYVNGLPGNARGGEGNDRIIVQDGTNHDLFGDEGNDYIKFLAESTGIAQGGDGDDRMIGNDARQVLVGDAGSDVLLGLGGDDIIEGGLGNDFLYGGRDNDTVTGGAGDDVLRGNRGDDDLNGEGGSDRMFGGGGDDELAGEEGRDFLLGENGNDILDGGEGNDNLTGGAGVDAFMFATGYGFDRILDFENGVDVLNVADTGVSTLAEITVSAAGGGADTRLSFGDGDTLYLDGVTTSQIDSSDFIFAFA